MKINVRASSLVEALDCGLRWASKHIDGKRLPASAPAAIGSAVHASTAVHDLSDLKPHQSAGAAVDYLTEAKDDIVWDGITFNEAERRALALHSRYCADVAPHYAFTTVEHTLDPFPIDAGNGVTVVLSGTLDRVHRKGDSQGVIDIKTGGRAVEKHQRADGTMTTRANIRQHGPQLGVYHLLAEQQIGAMDLAPGIIGLQSSKDVRIAYGEIPNAREALLGNAEHPGFIRAFAQELKSGVFKPNPASFLCSPKYCPNWNDCLYHA